MASSQASNDVEVCGRDLEELRVLGAGGQGTVSLCKDRSSGQLFAVKTSKVDGDGLANEHNTVRYLMDSGVREGIVQVHGMCTVDSGLKSGLLMDFCDGGDLMSHLKQNPEGRLEDGEAAAVMKCVAESLWRCHEVGIMHRDIKPQNILLCRGHHTPVGVKRARGNTDPWSSILLADFGFAREFRRGGLMRGPMVGTPGYTAPEVMRGCYDERADVWSLGIVLHQLLTGEFPIYIQKICEELEMNKNMEKVPFFYRAVKECPDELDLTHPMYSQLTEGARSLLAGILKKKPDQRLTLAEVRAHTWLHLPVAAAQSRDSNNSVSGHELKRARIIMLEQIVPAEIHYNPLPVVAY